jgi:hypothetical protein
MPDPNKLIFTLSLIICTNGVSNTSNPLFHNSFRVMSPAIPKGLFCVKGDSIFTFEIIAGLLECINSFKFERSEFFISLFSFTMSVTKWFFFHLSHFSLAIKFSASLLFLKA